MESLPPALAPLGHYRQFIVYKLVPRTDGSGKTDKFPIDYRTGKMFIAGQNWQKDPAAWTDADTAIQVAAQLGPDYGPGFLFTDHDPFVFIDLDNCLINGQWSPVAIGLCKRLAGAAVEISQSGTGLHIFGAASNVPAHGCDNKLYGLEMYHKGRFVALTGVQALGSAAHDLTSSLPAFVTDYFPAPTSGAVRPAEWTIVARDGYGGPDSDDELITLMMGSGSGVGQVFGNKAGIADLWNADPGTLGRAYPDTYGSRSYDASKADAALAAHLAFWTGGNCERVERLMRRSALARDKWNTHKTYLCEFTITKAVSRCDNIYTGKQITPVQQLPAAAAGVDLPFQAMAETFAFIGARNSRLIRFNTLWFTCEAGGYYREIGDEMLRAELRTATPWQLTTTKINNAIDELKSVHILDAHGVELPYWIDGNQGMPDARSLIVCRNGILDPLTHLLYKHNDGLLTFNALPFDYDPAAPVPIRWLQFLAEIFTNDNESIYELQKLFGYLLTQDTSLQKIFVFVGQRRSGKGTLARILRELIGPENTCAPSINRIGNEFGLEAFVGKQVAVFPDARVGQKTDKVVVAERLLSISGEDALDIGRKHKGDWHGRLTSRLVFLANEAPILNDTSGALVGRYVLFYTPDSFYGREDRDLTDRLRVELPGILNWALEGLQLLRNDGRINTPQMAGDLVGEIDSLGSPVKGFVIDSCSLGDGLMVAKDALWLAYRQWHNDNGVSGHPMSKAIFGRVIKTAYPGQLHNYRPSIAEANGKRPRYWSGITLVGLAHEVFSQ